jgi:hypothetical protein
MGKATTRTFGAATADTASSPSNKMDLKAKGTGDKRALPSDEWNID